MVSATGTLGAFGGIFMLLPVLFLIVFHIGAGYLSYQKNGSAGWAFLSFLFAYFYYPYYAFTSAPASATTTMMGGIRKLVGRRR
jgi:membrane protein implicated in regulation of membrane protease activity